MTRNEIMAALGLKNEKHFRQHYQQAGIAAGVIEMTISDKPKSSKQNYRVTENGLTAMLKCIYYGYTI